MKKWIFCFLILFCIVSNAYSETTVNVATYNIKFLNSNVDQQGNRLQKLKDVIELLDADVIGLQEIDDRSALKKIFPENDWHIIIDDDSGENQDVALVVRKPFSVLGIDPDLNADDNNFLFPNSGNNSHFPDRRDVLSIEIKVPNENHTFFVMVCHAKSRFGGRADNDSRREGASRDIISILERDFEDRNYILLGDFNDNPDDRSLNILETGDPNVSAGPEEIQGPFMINLTEPLLVVGHVSHGRKSNDIIGDHVNTIDSESRRRNNENRGTNVHTGDILFDQILIPPRMFDKYVQGSAQIFNHKVGVNGNNTNRASDHLPVSAEFVFDSSDSDEETALNIMIASLLPNPNGIDNGNEQVTLRNNTQNDINLTGWKLRDRAGNEYNLSGIVPSNNTLTITMTTFSMPLNNSGDDITLIDDKSNPKDHVSYTSSQVKSGVVVKFE
ncbi:MAG: endonuclease/exonuclease/phosphatase family protein [Planctomycetota bacterium]|jgi:endonuclease/exonuclease/phosphatase family metal-dependent hydrolase